MRMLNQLIFGVCICILVYLHPITAKGKFKCSTCEGIVEKFKEGLKKTAKSNFGGGNTDWEEKSLGTWHFSETRLIEITDGLCSEKECHSMLEEYEELIERWWFREYAKRTLVDLHQFLCIANAKVCCPNGTFGPTCRDCAGGKTRPCSGNGKCEGAGTREGTGKCTCDAGYTGDVCDDCAPTHYEDDRNETHVTCLGCDESCKDGCDGGGPKGCDECKAGYTHSEEEGCMDMNECAVEVSPCLESQYCENTPGSMKCVACNAACWTCTGPGADECKECGEKYYEDVDVCKPCHKACASSCKGGTERDCEDECADGWTMSEADGCVDVDECAGETSPCKEDQYCDNHAGSYSCFGCGQACEGCTGAGAEKCVQCKEGYHKQDDKCVDVDECAAEQPPCGGKHQQCVNSPGTYTCQCQKGYYMDKDKCKLEKKKKKRKPKKIEVEKKVTDNEREPQDADSGSQNGGDRDQSIENNDMKEHKHEQTPPPNAPVLGGLHGEL